MNKIKSRAVAVAIIAVFSMIIPASAGTVTDGVLTNVGPDSFIGFEYGTDGQLIGTVTGVQFTTTDGYDWVIGDFATGNYNGKYPSGSYTSDGNKWAWLGTAQPIGRIDFTEGTASYVSILTSTAAGLELEAYAADGTLLDEAIYTGSNTNTGSMAKMEVTDSGHNIAYVIVHDSGNYFLIDDISTDAPGVKDINDPNGADIPEFPTIALPVISIIGLMFLFQRQKGE